MFDADKVEWYGTNARLRKSVSVDTFMGSDHGERYYDQNAEEPLIGLEGEEREAERQRIDEEATPRGKRAISSCRFQ